MEGSDKQCHKMLDSTENKMEAELLCGMVSLSEAYVLLLMDKILYDPKDPKLWESWYIPHNG